MAMQYQRYNRIYHDKGGVEMCGCVCVCVNAGTHKVEIEYCSLPITGSPFMAKICDPSGIRVTGIADGNVNQESQFEGELDYVLFVSLIIHYRRVYHF